jgi:hypothetical protein
MSRNRCDGCVLYFKLRARKPWHILAPICRFLITSNVLSRKPKPKMKQNEKPIFISKVSEPPPLSSPAPRGGG